MKPVLLLIGLLFLSACSPGGESLPPQVWKDFQVRLDPRPNPPVAGMNEFIIIANEADGKPAYRAVVSIRLNDQGEWKQAIQDGQTGVFRRAHVVENPATDFLSVQIKMADSEGELQFRLEPGLPN